MSNNQVKKTAKNIYTMLYKKGLSVSTTLIEAEVLKISESGDLTTEQKKAIAAIFENQNPAIETGGGEGNLVPTVGTNDIPSFDEVTEQDSKDEPPVTSSLALNQRQANSLVLSAILETSLEIATSEMKQIATNIVSRNLSEDDALDYIHEVITALIDAQESQYNKKLSQTMSSVISSVNDSYSRRNESLNQSVASLKGELEASTSAYKSSLRHFKSSLSSDFEIEGFN